MDYLSDYSGIIFVASIGLFFLSRWVNLWYWKVNDFQKGQQEQIRLLKKIAGEEETKEDVPAQETKTLSVIIIMCCLAVPGYAQISAGGSHSLMLCGDSLVWSVGYNGIGQLGDSTTITRITPVQVTGLTNIISVKSGLAHSIALKDDGTVWSWGDNTQGQLGNSTTISSIVPIQVPGLSNIIKIIAGGNHNIAITNDSLTWMWGDNGFKQINGAGADLLWPIKTTSISNVIDVSAGVNHTLILYKDSTIALYTTGNTGWGYGITGVLQIGSGDKNFFAITSDTIWGWGENSFGQLGDSTTIDRPTPVPVLMSSITGLNNIVSITGGNRHSMALRSDGTVWTWGWNGWGQLGDGTLIDKLVPVQVLGLDSVTSISTKWYYSLVFRNDSTVWGWGENGSGQLGDSTSTNTNIPVQMMLSCIPYQCTSQTYLSNSTICEGDSILISGIYQQTASTYYDSLIGSNGCDSVLIITLAIDSLPTVIFTGLDTVYCITSSPDTLIGLPVGGVFSGAGMIGSVFAPFSTGLFTITYSYTDGNGCTNTYSQDVTINNCVSIEDIGFDDFKIYPNPTTGVVNIGKRVFVEITNSIGEIIYRQSSDEQIDISGYSKGVYFIRISNESTVRTVKLILF